MRIAPRLAVLALLASATGAYGTLTAFAAPEAAGPLTRYQTRLEADAFRILTPEVLGPVKDSLALHRTEMGAALSVTEWQSLLINYAPALEKASRVLVRRTEVIWSEERVSDPYASSMLQQAAIGSLQRGLVRVLAQFGVPVAPGKAAPESRPAAIPTPVAKKPAPPVSAAPPAAPTRSTAAALLAYRTGLDAEAFRILTPEMTGGIHKQIAAKRLDLQSAQTVSQWTAILVQAAPSLDKACRVLGRRTEVRLKADGLVDAYESAAVQRTAVEGLQAGVDRILKQFGM